MEKALRELALQVLPPTTRGGAAPAAALALGADAFAELSQRFFDLAENAADFMPSARLARRRMGAAALGRIPETGAGTVTLWGRGAQ